MKKIIHLLQAYEFESFEIYDLNEIKKELENYKICIGKNIDLGNGVTIGFGCKIGNNIKFGNTCIINPYSKIGDNCQIGANTEINGNIECNVNIGDDCIINTWTSGLIESDVNIGNNVKLMVYSLNNKTFIGDNCNISASSLGYYKSYYSKGTRFINYDD